MKSNEIDKIIEAHELWLSCNGEVGKKADFHGLNLRDIDLRDSDFQGVNFSEADLRGANFNRANLQGANLNLTNLTGTDFERANLRGASLQNLKEDLSLHDMRIDQIPLVIQYNKIDLVENGIPLLTTETLKKDLDKIPGTPSFEASAQLGINVIATLKRIIVSTVASVQKDLESAELSPVCEAETGAADI